jgi:hypothetical protein
MEQIVKDLKKMMPFKDTVELGDIVLIAAKKPQMLVYALITDIVRDESKRDEWWKVSMQILSLPPQKVMWILRTEQMTGLETFTMDGEPRFMKGVEFGEKNAAGGDDVEKESKGKPSLRRVK